MRRVLSDALISLAALVLLFTLLLAVDDRVKQRVSAFWTPDSSEFAGASQQVGSFVTLTYEVVKDQSIAHAPLTIFTVAAAVLVIFMVRT
jgi:hypothetical protein